VFGSTKPRPAEVLGKGTTYNYDVSSTPIGTYPAPQPATPSSSSSKNPYQQAYSNLQSMDTQELLNVTFGSQDNANANILSVLSQWAAIQVQEQAAQEQAIQDQLSALGTSSSSTSGGDVPSLGNVIAQSDAQANDVLSKYASAPAGSSIVDYQA